MRFGAIALAIAALGCDGETVVVRCSDDAPVDEYGLYECGEAKVRLKPVTCDRGMCETDADCESGWVCYCGPLGANHAPNEGICAQAECVTSTDCGGDSECIALEDRADCNSGFVGVRFHCTSASDACASARSCGEGQGCYAAEGEGLGCSDAVSCGAD